MSDGFAMLIEDHRKVDRLFQEFEQSGDYALARKICEELTMHATLEEELIYPLYRSKVETAGADEARREHQEAKDIIARIGSLGDDDDQLRAAVQELKQAVQHHVEEEENELFPQMQATLPGIVNVLGADLEERRQQLLDNFADDREINLPASAMGAKPNAAPS